METDISNDLEQIGKEASFLDAPIKNRLVVAGVLAVVALVSMFLLSGIFSSPDTYAKTIESLDNKKETVLLLTASSAGASAALSAIPDDTCTPLAERLADLSGDFLIILTAIYLEKYLLTTFGFVTFALLIPISCILVIVGLFIKRRPSLQMPLIRLAEKLTLLGIAFILTVPASVFISNKIESTYKDSINNTIESAQITMEAAQDTTEEVKQNDSTEPLEFFQERVTDLQNAAGDLVNALGGALEWVQNIIGNFIEAIAVMIVISCVLPILVLVFFLWLVKLILGVNVDMAMAALRPGALGRFARRV